jgi:hypothetical protein
MPSKEIADPKRTMDLMESVEPTLPKSKTDIDDPRRVNDLSDKEDPRCKKSKTDSAEPTLA